MSAFLHRFFYLLTVLSFAALLAVIGADFVRTRQLAKGPQSPQPELGKTIPYDVGRRRVFISREDHVRNHEMEGYRNWLALALIVFGLTAALYERLRRFDARQ